MTIQYWGITYEKLEPYYDRFEKTMSISGDEDPFADKRLNSYPTRKINDIKCLNYRRQMEVNIMGIGNIGIPGLILIVILALIIFGPKKLPDIGRAAGQTLREFKKSTNDLMSDDDSPEDLDKKRGSPDEKT